jgi:hypothetical protein
MTRHRPKTGSDVIQVVDFRTERHASIIGDETERPHPDRRGKRVVEIAIAAIPDLR